MRLNVNSAWRQALFSFTPQARPSRLPPARPAQRARPTTWGEGEDLLKSAAFAALALALGLGPPATALAEPTLAIALYAKPSNRPALRAALQGEQAQRLRTMRKQGLIKSYRLLFTRYADAGVWDGLELLSFRDEAALSQWKAVERTSPGGLAATALGLTDQVVSTPADSARSGGEPHETAEPAFLVIPYQASVSTPEYLKYLDGYTVPQFDGWVTEHVLNGYEIEISRFPADRPWVSLILLRYRDDAALARRDETTAKVRARLAGDPAWKAISDNKKSVRTEKIAAVADQLAAEN
ncbi:MAG: hypothetical protein JWQ52_2421 [Phenylobacterium sp.]|jgi:hypothetical protein|nr:hypothetical protein [Phenylobacterium sp.]